MAYVYTISKIQMDNMFSHAYLEDLPLVSSCEEYLDAYSPGILVTEQQKQGKIVRIIHQ